MSFLIASLRKEGEVREEGEKRKHERWKRLTKPGDEEERKKDRKVKKEKERGS